MQGFDKALQDLKGGKVLTREKDLEADDLKTISLVKNDDTAEMEIRDQDGDLWEPTQEDILADNWREVPAAAK